MSLLERDTVMVSTDEEGNAVVDLPHTRANNVEGLGRSFNTYYSVGNVVYVDSNLSVALKCTTAGTTSNTELDVSGRAVGDSVEDGSVVWMVIDRGFEVATQSEAEAGTDNTTVMTPKGVDYRLNKDRKIKTYYDLSPIGLSFSSDVTHADIFNALPNNSMLLLQGTLSISQLFPTYSGGADYYGLLQYLKTESNRCTVSFISGRNKSYFASLGGGDFGGWQQVISTSDIATQAEAEAGTDNATVMTPLRTKNAIDKRNFATNGALSMPSGSSVDVSITATGEKYIAPCDGWLCIEFQIGSESAFACGVGVGDGLFWSYLNGINVTEWDCVVPLKRGELAEISMRHGNKILKARFIYAQSEV